jgi:hypothetical protein
VKNPVTVILKIRMESYGQTGWFEELIFHIQLLFLAALHPK